MSYSKSRWVAVTSQANMGVLAKFCFLAYTGFSLAFTQCHLCAFMYDISKFLSDDF